MEIAAGKWSEQEFYHGRNDTVVVLGNKFRTSRKNLHILAFQFSDNKQTQHAGDVYVDINIFGAVHHFMNLLRKDKKTLRQLNNRANLYVEAKLQPVDDQRDAILIKQ
jgi:hypothetical protein